MFDAARIRLSCWYIVIIMAISLMFSFALYRASVNEVVRFEQLQRYLFERSLIEQGCRSVLNPSWLGKSDFILQARRRIMTQLLWVNALIFLGTGGLAYFVAGRQLEPIKEMVLDQQRFVGDASHELKTPLTALKTSLEVYLRQDKRTVAEADQVITDALLDVNQLQTLAESLLQLAQHDMRSDQLVFSEVAVDHILSMALARVQMMAKARQISFVVTPRVSKLQVWGEVEQLTALVVILVDNAIKYSQEKSQIRLSVKQVGKQVKIAVQDQGVGISPQDISQIFERFYRADSARTRQQTGGHGLGLAIARQIVVRHQGTITVKSRLGAGSTFTVALPSYPSRAG